MLFAKDNLYKLIDELPEKEIFVAEKFLLFLVNGGLDEETVIEPLYDDELSEVDKNILAAAEADMKAGRVKSWAEVKNGLNE